MLFLKRRFIYFGAEIKILNEELYMRVRQLHIITEMLRSILTAPCLIGLLALGLAVASRSPERALADAPPPGTPFRFALACDQREYAGPGMDALEYFRGACEALASIGAGAFMISPGDIDPPSGVAWTIGQYVGSDYVWYPGVGNHEAETQEDMDWLRAYNAGGNSLPHIVNIGPEGTEETTYSFDYGDAHFVQINEYYDGINDVGLWGDIIDPLYDWLEADLMATDKQWIFVIGHEPAWPLPDAINSNVRHRWDSLDEHATNRDRFWDLLKREGVAAYFCGHTHTYSAMNIDGVWQIDAAHARGIGDSGAVSTFLVFDITPERVTFETYRSLVPGGPYSLFESRLLACQSCSTHVFQHGIFPDALYGGAIDTCLEDGQFHGSADIIAVDGNPQRAGLLRWELSGFPVGANVTAAWITLFVNETSPESYEVYEMRREWDEAFADWYQYADGALWSAPGAGGDADRGSTQLGTITGLNYGLYIIPFNPSGIELVQSWLDEPETNHGVILLDYTMNDAVRYYSREHTDPVMRPKLTVQVSLPVPTVTPSPAMIPTTGTAGTALLAALISGVLIARRRRNQ